MIEGIHKYGTHKENTFGFRKHRIYRVWASMKRRCLCKKDPDYRYYGGRGITLCDRWKSFYNFRVDMLPSWALGMTLERKDNLLGYSPDNCRWATRMDQGKNKRNNRIIEHLGKRMTVTDWARETGIKATTIYSRLNLGWTDPARILSQPPLWAFKLNQQPA